MPEGPEVRVVTDYLSDQLVGQQIVKVTCSDNEKFFRINGKRTDNTFPIFKSHLPAVIDRVFCKGKCIFFELRPMVKDDAVTTGRKRVIRRTGTHSSFYLYCHLIMTGRWSDLVNTSTGRGSDSDCKLTLHFGTCRYIGRMKTVCVTKYIRYIDPRGLGRFEFMTKAQMDEKVAKLGPDLLSDTLTFDQWQLITGKCPRRQLVSFLMDQQYVAGIGNYLKAEILYRAKLRPDRKLGSLSEDENHTLFQHCVATIRESYSYGGLTIKNFWHPSGQAGTFPREIYGKKVDPHGNEIVTDSFADGRTTHWVPAVQR